MATPDNNSLEGVDYWLLLAVLASLGYGMQLLVPGFTAIHMPIIAVAVLIGGVAAYVTNPGRFKRAIRSTATAIVVLAMLRLAVSIAFHHRYDVLAAKLGSALTLVYLFQQINGSESDESNKRSR